MTGLDDVTNDLFGHWSRPQRDRSMTRLAEGLVHLEYADTPDEVYLVHVTGVPRVRLPLESPVPVRHDDGVTVALVAVEVAHYVDVWIDALPNPRLTAATDQFRRDMDAWSQAAAMDPDLDQPPWPADTYGRVAISVADDVGTAYGWQAGRAGGDGTEWLTVARFLPTPPAAASQLTLTVPDAQGRPQRVTLPLPGDRDSRGHVR